MTATIRNTKKDIKGLWVWVNWLQNSGIQLSKGQEDLMLYNYKMDFDETDFRVLCLIGLCSPKRS